MSAVVISNQFRAEIYKPPEIERGRVLARHVEDRLALEYFLYVPRTLAENAPLFVSVHGISRNAREHADLFAPYAEQYGCVLVAPCFSRQSFRAYQRLGRRGRGLRADRALRRITNEVGRLTGAYARKIFMFGYSGGGQFAHRYAMAYPSRVRRLVIGAPGWYTFPDESISFPHGIAPSPKLPKVNFVARKFLRIPVCVMVGQWDIRRDEDLNTSERIDQQQGCTRMERGRRWVDAMNRASAELGYETRHEFKVIQRCNHDFTRSMMQGSMGDHVVDYLFGALAQGAAACEEQVPVQPVNAISRKTPWQDRKR